MIVLLPHLLLNRKAGRKPLVDGPGLMQQQNLPYCLLGILGTAYTVHSRSATILTLEHPIR